MLLEKEGTDFIGLAQTGTGKTAAFGLPLLDRIEEGSHAPQALIMAPTRELGQQIAQQLVTFSQNNQALNVEVVYGGTSIYHQIKALKKSVQVVVATPGRLLDLIRRKAVKLDQVQTVVLDEADEMLNMGFKEDIDSILDHTGDEAAIWLFSATMPPEIRRIVDRYMDEPLEVKVNTKEISNTDITHQYVVTKVVHKLEALKRFLDLQPEMRGVLFCRTKRETEELAERLGAEGYSVAALNGDLSQAQRDKVMKMFKTRSMQLLIATDVAARGIDVQDLSHVLHYNLPDQVEYYTHRSGRTGRAGRKGISLAFIISRDFRRIRDIERRIKVQFERIQVPNHQEIVSHRLEQWATRLTETELHPSAEEFLFDLEEKFEDLSKEELLQKLVSAQLNRLGEEGEDLNVKERERGDRRNDRRSSSSNNRFFINVGKMDGVTQAGLIQFLSGHSGLGKEQFSGISLQQKCAYFDVSEGNEAGFEHKFKGVEVDGRRVRVNRDVQKNRSRKFGRPGRGGGNKGYGNSRYKGKSGNKNSRSGNKYGGKKKRY